MLARYIVGRAAIMSTIVDRAVRRGEVPTGTGAAEAIQAVTAQLYYRLVRRRRAAQSGDPPTVPRPSPPPPAAGRSAPTHDPSKNVSPRNDCHEAA
jgi:hypothetical protein